MQTEEWKYLICIILFSEKCKGHSVLLLLALITTKNANFAILPTSTLLLPLALILLAFQRPSVGKQFSDCVWGSLSYSSLDGVSNFQLLLVPLSGSRFSPPPVLPLVISLADKKKNRFANAMR